MGRELYLHRRTRTYVVSVCGVACSRTSIENINRMSHSYGKNITRKMNARTQVPEGYDDLMRRCCKYKANQRPLIDVVRDKLQDLLERAAEIDREKTAHLEITREGSLARSRLLFKMMGGNDGETKKSSISKDSSMRRQSSKTNRSRTESRLRRHSTGSSMQGNSTTEVHIEMGTFSSSSDSIGGKEVGALTESKDDSSSGGVTDASPSSLGETPFKL